MHENDEIRTIKVPIYMYIIHKLARNLKLIGPTRHPAWLGRYHKLNPNIRVGEPSKYIQCRDTGYLKLSVQFVFGKCG